MTVIIDALNIQGKNKEMQLEEKNSAMDKVREKMKWQSMIITSLHHEIMSFYTYGLYHLGKMGMTGFNK